MSRISEGEADVTARVGAMIGGYTVNSTDLADHEPVRAAHQGTTDTHLCS